MDITTETTEDGGRQVLISYVALSENAHLAETSEQIAEILAVKAGLVPPLRVSPFNGSAVYVYADR